MALEARSAALRGKTKMATLDSAHYGDSSTRQPPAGRVYPRLAVMLMRSEALRKNARCSRLLLCFAKRIIQGNNPVHPQQVIIPGRSIGEKAIRKVRYLPWRYRDRTTWELCATHNYVPRSIRIVTAQQAAIPQYSVYDSALTAAFASGFVTLARRIRRHHGFQKWRITWSDVSGHSAHQIPGIRHREE